VSASDATGPRSILSPMPGPVSVEVRNVFKSFETNSGTWAPFRERIRQTRRRGPRMSVLEDLDFDVHLGEVFGVVGPNGAGKSTLLKLIAGIYPIDRGRIRVAGRVAPLIELGVGFRPELPARENILINGVMMGLSAAEARRRTDEIIEFAELEDFTDLRLKNYSSGMRGRLGFSVMTHVDADVLLIDEILAVGDKGFRDKCGDVIASMRDRGKTVVLVSHEMGSINRHCDRALLLYERRIQRLGEPEDVANAYLAVNQRRRWTNEAQRDGAADAAEVTVLGFVGDSAEAGSKLPGRVPIEVEAEIELRTPLRSPEVRFTILDSGGRPLYVAPPRPLEPGLDRVQGTFRVGARIENRLASGRYALMCRVTEPEPEDGDGEALRSPGRWLGFAVEGPDEIGSVVSVDSEIEVESTGVEVDHDEAELGVG
jgi:ABC-type polysaccharide/polyol phosphate transport system ATPase subunit